MGDGLDEMPPEFQYEYQGEFDKGAWADIKREKFKTYYNLKHPPAQD